MPYNRNICTITSDGFSSDQSNDQSMLELFLFLFHKILQFGRVIDPER